MFLCSCDHDGLGLGRADGGGGLICACRSDGGSASAHHRGGGAGGNASGHVGYDDGDGLSLAWMGSEISVRVQVMALWLYLSKSFMGRSDFGKSDRQVLRLSYRAGTSKLRYNIYSVPRLILSHLDFSYI